MRREMRVSLSGLVACCSHVMDLVSAQVADHHARVACIASALADEVGLSRADWRDVVLAAALHDVGALSLQARLDALKFELDEPSSIGHADLGYELLRHFRPLAQAAAIVRHHHVWWQDGAGAVSEGAEVAPGSHIVHLADRVSVLLRYDEDCLSQASEVRDTVRDQAGKMFRPDLVDAWLSLATREHFWLDVGSVSSESIPQVLRRLDALQLDMPDLLAMGEMFARIIDFRSPYTATHSAGVASCAEAIARLVGFSKGECLRMRVAGYLHDLGKLRIPAEILEKAGALSAQERMIIRGHTYYAYRAVEHISGLHSIRNWAFLHHERLDGGGYPFHLTGDDLSLGSRIMAVADVFTALTEDRPYRPGMSLDNALGILSNMVSGGALDSTVFQQLRGNIEEVNQIRQEVQSASIREYRRVSAGSLLLAAKN